MVPENTDRRKIKTTGTLFEIIEQLQAQDGARITDLAEELRFSPGTIHTHLSTLEELEYVCKRGEEYHLSLRFLDSGIHARDNIGLVHPAREPLKRVSRNTEEVVWLFTEEHGYAVFLYREMGDAAVQTYGRVGKHQPFHTVAGGKVIMAHRPQEYVDKMIEKHGLPAVTANTITDRDHLYDELDTIRERGYGFNDEEATTGLRAVSAPIFNGETVIGGISVSGPAHRLKGQKFNQELPDELLGAANSIELKLEYPADG